MKNYKQLVKNLPSKTAVFTVGKFNPPTSAHELLVKSVKKLASNVGAEHIIYTTKQKNSKKDPLTEEKRNHYLNLLFPNTKFVNSSETSNIVEIAKKLNENYKNLIMLSGSDKVLEYKNILEQHNGKDYNYESIQVLSYGERDPDSASISQSNKIISLASKGLYEDFKKNLPSNIRDIDGKLLMNDVRIGLNLEPIKEQVKFDIENIRESYYQGEIFLEGQQVESSNIVYTIIKRGSNHLLLEDSDGNKVSKWINDVKYLSNETQEEAELMMEDLTNKTIKPNDKLKVARMIANFLGYDKAESSSNPESLVNLALRKVKPKLIHSDSIDILNKMLKLANEVGIKYDTKLLPAKMKESVEPRVVKIDTKSKRNAGGDIMSYKDFKRSLDINKGIKESEDNPQNIDMDNLDDIEDIQPDDDIKVMDTDGKIYNIKKWDYRRVGHTLGSGMNDTLRRMRVKYKMNEEVVAEKIDEDSWSADYKINPKTGRKTRAHYLDFKNSQGNLKPKTIGKPADKSDDEDLDEVTQVTGTSAIIARENELELTKAEKKTKKPDAFVRDDSGKLGANNAKGFDAFFEEVDEDIPEDELDKMVDSIDDEEDMLDAYDDDELAIIDDETGEEVEEIKEEDELKEQALNEVLSRQERIKSKIRFARTKSKRARKLKIALKKRSGMSTINRRARKLAVLAIKKRFAKKPLNKLSIGEKERIEKIVAKKKKLIDRLALKMVPKVRKNENERLSHSKYTKK
jgi:hypothetical protein